jgi:Iron-containing redox enzyme
MTIRTNQQTIRNRIGLVVGPMTEAYERLKTHPQLESLYPEYLLLTHMIIRSSVPLLRDALNRLDEMPLDPLSDGLRSYFGKHILEEMGHDEWVLDDLSELGIDPTTVLERMPPPSVAAMVGSQYYWIRHYHPVAFLGYVAVLEGYPARIEDIEEMIVRTKLPPVAFRTWVKHAELDSHHRREFDSLVESLPLTPPQITCICLSGMNTVRYAIIAFNELFDMVET